MIRKIAASYTLALIGLIVVLGSCKKEYESIETADDAKIQQYIQKNNLTVTKDSSGFYYQVIPSGNPGEKFTSKDSVLYHVEIKSLLNGTSYFADPSRANLGTFVGYANNLNGYNIPAIRTTILDMVPGDQARILLPSYLAFGRNGFETINVPSNEIIDLVITTFPEKDQKKLDDRLIREFISKNNISGMVKHPSGVYYSVVTPDSSKIVFNGGSTINAKYNGKYLDGVSFDSSTDGIDFSLTGVIPAWQKVIPMGKVGSKLRLLVPSAEGYGTLGSSPIPPNAILDFDVEVVKLVTN